MAGSLQYLEPTLPPEQDELYDNYRPTPIPEGDIPPTWVEDGADSPEEHERMLVALVQDLLQESREKYGPIKLKWKRADKLMELGHILDRAATTDPAETKLPFLAAAIEEYLASRLDESLVPAFSSRQQSMDQLVAALNYFKEVELEANQFSLLKLRLKLQQIRFRIGFLKLGVDPWRKSVFGHRGKQIISLFDPRNFWPDALADGTSWEENRYMIFVHQMDVTDVAKMYPEKAHCIKGDPRLSIRTNQDADLTNLENMPGSVQFAGREVAGKQVGTRDRCLVVECYLKDSRPRYVPYGYDDMGMPWCNKDGEIILTAQDRYPRGRLIVICGDVLLRDSENPYMHGEPPVVTFKESPYEGWFSYSPLECLDIVDRKIQQLMKGSHKNLLFNMDSPIVIDRKAFSKPDEYDELEQEPGAVWVVNTGGTITRLPPGMLPPDAAQFIDRLGDVFDSTLGITAIDRGNLEQGSQVSSQTVQDLQGASQSRRRLKTELDKIGMEELGKKFASNIRQFYPKQKQVQVKDPTTGADISYAWNAEEFQEEWLMKIEVASSSPGAKQSAEQQALQLFDKGVVDQQYVLQTMKIPLDVKKRMDDLRMQIASIGTEKAIKEALNLGRPKKAGRRPQQMMV